MKNLKNQIRANFVPLRVRANKIGEFGKSKTGKYEFHNNTCCVVALKEKQA